MRKVTEDNLVPKLLEMQGSGVLLNCAVLSVKTLQDTLLDVLTGKTKYEKLIKPIVAAEIDMDVVKQITGTKLLIEIEKRRRIKELIQILNEELEREEKAAANG